MQSWYVVFSSVRLPLLPATNEQARDIVLSTDGIEQTRALAQDYAEQAIASISWFPPSDAKNGLIEMASKTLKRQK